MLEAHLKQQILPLLLAKINQPSRGIGVWEINDKPFDCQPLELIEKALKWNRLLQNSFAPNIWNVYRDFSGLIEMSERLCRSLLKSEALSNVLTIHKENPFDLVLIELFATDCPLGIASEMNLTTIGISPCALMPWHYTRFNLMDFPSFIPTENSPFATQMTFWERIVNFLTGKVMKILFRLLWIWN